ncbi:MAG: hypothetical protein ACLF0G_07040 [Candidatus Brocadiia bacterium]
MAREDDGRLERLLQRAAPQGPPPGFADAVVAVARARRRARRRLRLGLAAAAVLALGAGLALHVASPRRRPGPQAARSPGRPAGTAAEEAPEAASFAVRLPSAAQAQRCVMIARVNGAVAIASRPVEPDLEAEGEEHEAVPSMACWVSSGGEGPSLAVRIR